MELLAALAIGFVGSLHCVGMCGAIALSLPVSPQRSRFLWGRLLYNLGRISTYTILGIVFGMVGSVARIAGAQEYLSIGVGIGILFWLLLPKRQTAKLIALPGVARGVSILKKSLAPLFHSHALLAQYGVGLLNGFLPCGFVYMGLAGALVQHSTAESALFMMLFGAGTLPAMLLLSLAPALMRAQSIASLRRFIPVGAAVVATLFILRGMALGIPYLSPVLPATVDALSQSKQEQHCGDFPLQQKP